ncbi:MULTISPECIES: SDR family oxidoreductase [unclassified Pseudomonas]|jgi:NAD(P)-dependent dehydrogenase (short-subunit alcohol dehydrogenase family)|uniref:SDR family oxidoreductase n=1 Tax=unclassified Pseudomonas TaxID=196821 RepID=UPI00129DE40A|nr:MULTISPECIES: SDR family oxidoreductase [unclassified Pseudomonas]MDH4651755.1 SDR family oxidoreductase [Pseudomonas sp. BN606]MRK22995.1 SDR family oxidoreductase [Pseudomonas sp. JG-B]
MLLNDKVVMISGIGPGMGIKLALESAREGARAVAICARNEARLREAEQRIRALGTDCQVLWMCTDVIDPDACRRFAEATVERFGRIDALVNSAYAHGGFESLEGCTDQLLQEALDVNLFGSLHLTRAVLPHMKAQGTGAIVMVSTLGVFKPYAGGGAYAISKGSLAVAVRYLASELAGHGLRVNGLACGWMWGEPVHAHVRTAAAARGVSEEQVRAEFSAGIPGGRMPGDEECARAALFLVSDYASAINGAQLDSNGGELMR